MSKPLRISTLLGVVISITLFASVADGGKKNGKGPSERPLRSGCVKFEGAEIGKDNVSKSVKGVTITVFDWIEKTDSEGEYVGFSYVVDGDDAIFAVKCGQEVFRGSHTFWVHPNGRSGRFVNGISSIAFCVAPDSR